MNSNQLLFTYIKIEILRFLREPVSLFFTLIFPIILIYVFGDSFGGTTSKDTGITYYNSLVSIDIAFLIANFTLMGIGNDLANQKELGILENSSLLPIKKWYKTVLESIAYLMILFVSSILVTIYVYTFYDGIHFRGNLLIYILFIILSYFTFVSITRFIVSLDYSARTIQLINSSFFFILLFTSGIVIPKESLPVALQGFVSFSPLYGIYFILDGIWNDTASAKNISFYSGYFMVLILIFSILSKWKKIRS
ncbi:ABC transporter permease [Rummeliibacillus suwonensis]|uniref:ABC transporter permease n=1 Tax=Rummeliibacillus suwonensis TaxID=1306154 RepID=UPI001AAF039B|nr:ABC transporter permease [Rummeliibacillus suwonensis]MBO2535784.1 ABC transporter permease [Rummeliibacillus suwonensis]